MINPKLNHFITSIIPQLFTDYIINCAIPAEIITQRLKTPKHDKNDLNTEIVLNYYVENNRNNNF